MALQVEVQDVQRCQDGRVAHFTAVPVSQGASVRVSVDWSRRYDHMQQHTGQHLVSAVCDEILGADTVSWELHARAGKLGGSDNVMVDLATPILTQEQMQVTTCCWSPVPGTCTSQDEVTRMDGHRTDNKE